MLTAAGLVPFTTIDYPGKLAAVIFLQGCPLRCPFCHNQSLQKNETPTNVAWTDIEEFLNNRRKMLDGIVLSGGEPLMNPDCVALAEKIKNRGYLLAIHTSGVYPDRLKNILPYTDWVGLDIKAPWGKYELLTGRKGMDKPVQESLRILLDSQIDFECRTTCDPRYLTVSDIFDIGSDLAGRNVQTYVLQHYRTFDGDVNPPDISAVESFFQNAELQNKLKKLFPKFSIR